MYLWIHGNLRRLDYSNYGYGCATDILLGLTLGFSQRATTLFIYLYPQICVIFQGYIWPKNKKFPVTRLGHPNASSWWVTWTKTAVIGKQLNLRFFLDEVIKSIDSPTLTLPSTILKILPHRKGILQAKGLKDIANPPFETRQYLLKPIKLKLLQSFYHSRPQDKVPVHSNKHRTHMKRQPSLKLCRQQNDMGSR